MKTPRNLRLASIAILCCLISTPVPAADFHYRVAAAGVRSLLDVPTYEVWTLPTKFSDSPPFTLPSPSSDSSGAFTYVSSNPAVAQVTGGIVTITGVGTAVITASQEASGSHLSGSTSAELSVFPARTYASYTQHRNTLQLSNNNRTIKGIGSDGNWGTAMAGTSAKSTGRWYVEFYPDVSASFYVGVVGAQLSDLMTPPGGGGGAGVGINNGGWASDGSGQWKLTGSGTYSGVVSLVVDLDARLVRFYRNCTYHGVVRMSAASNIATGSVKLAASLGPSNNGVIVSNFGQTEFSCKDLIQSFNGTIQEGWF